MGGLHNLLLRLYSGVSTNQLANNPESVPKLVGDFQDPIYGGKSAQFASYYRHMWQRAQNQPEMGQTQLTTLSQN